MGPDEVATRYGAPAESLQWYGPHAGGATALRAAGLKVIGKLLDPIRTLAWIRHNDVVIVPGMGVLEATLPLRPFAFPYSLFWLGVTARLTGTRVALLSVGSNVVRALATRWLITRAARLAHYRSFRDDLSRNSMREMGVDIAGDRVYLDLAFSLPNPPTAGPTGTVGVCVMAYHGSNDDRAEADQLHRHYVVTMTSSYIGCWMAVERFGSTPQTRKTCRFCGRCWPVYGRSGRMIRTSRLSQWRRCRN
jgi:hypothetical protein